MYIYITFKYIFEEHFIMVNRSIHQEISNPKRVNALHESELE